MMNSQKYKNDIYPDDFTDDDMLKFDYYMEQSKLMFPKMSNDTWLLKMGILAYMRKEKCGEIEPPSQEEIASIRNQYTKDCIFYTESDLPSSEVIEEKETVEISA